MNSQWEAQVVGINYYPNYTTLQQLTGAANDAEAVAVQLEQYGYQTFRVQRLPRQPNQKREWQIDPDKGVKMPELQEAISNLLMPPDGNLPDTALFFFSGHGWRKNVDGQDEVFLATSDVLPSHNNYGLSIDWLGNLIQSSPIQKLVIWLDCCYSGELTNYLPTNKDYCIFTATRSYEPGIEIRHQEGLFTRELRAGLNPNNYPDGMVDSHKLAKFIQERMAQTGQAPQCFNSDRSIPLTSKFTRRAFQDECPYRSLSCFTEKQQDAQVFYGRTNLTQDLVNRVREKERLIAVFGASGSGKSSLLRAGLLYQLKRGQEIAGSNNWIYFEPFTPTDHPLARFHAVVRKLYSSLNLAPEEGQENTTNLATQITEAVGDQIPIILIIDQFEECFTMSDEQQRQAFMDCLIELIETAPNLQLVIGMRSDFRNRLREYPRFAQKISKVNVGHLNSAEIQEAIEKPAEFVGLGIEGGLKQQLINDVEDYPESLPLLQYTLTELWNEARKQREQFLRLETYQGLGGIEGTLEKRADAVYESLLPEEQVVAKRIFLELTQVGDRFDTRRRIRLGDLVNSHHPLALLEQVTEKLANQENRLITRTAAEKVEDFDESQTQASLNPLAKGESAKIIIDVVHEALIRHWKQLEVWKQQYQAAMVIERKIEVAAQEWEERGEKPEYLLPGSRLLEAEEYVKDFSELGMLDGMAEKFIRESQTLRDQLTQEQAARNQRELDILEEKRKAEEKARQEAEKRAKEQAYSNQKLRQRANILKFLSVGAVGIASLAAYFWWDADRQKTTAEFKEQAATVQSQLSIEKNVGLLALALAAVGSNQKINENLFSVVKGGLFEAIEGIRERNIFKGHQKWVNGVAISTDGNTIVSGGKDGTVRLWNRSGKPIRPPLTDHQGLVKSVAVSADGNTVVSGGKDGIVRLWDRSGKLIRLPLEEGKSDIWSVAISADGNTIVSGGKDGTVRLWDRQGKPIRPPLTDHQGEVYSVAISADGNTIVSGGQDKTVRLWDRQGKSIEQPLSGHKSPVSSVAISADGNTIASGDDHGIVLLHDRNGELIGQPLKGHKNEVRGVSVSADGNTIASGGFDGTVRLWNRQGKSIGAPLSGYGGSVYAVAVSADGNTIVSGDAEVRLWDHHGGKESGVPWTYHKDTVSSVTVNKDGKTIVSGGKDGTVWLWNRNGQPIELPFKDHKGEIKSVAISTNGNMIVSGDKNGTLRLWNANGKEIRQLLKAHENVVRSVAVNEDGNTIVSGGADKIVRLWNRNGQPIGQPLTGHKGAVSSVAINTDGNTIVSGDVNGTVRLWDRSGKSIGQPLRHHGVVSAVAISANGNIIVSGGDGADRTVQWWDRSKSIRTSWKGHKGEIRSLTVSADGQTIISGGEDGTIRLWDSSGQLIGAPWTGHEGGVNSVALSADGQTIVSGGDDKTVRLWRGILWQNWVKDGCNRLQLHPAFTSPATNDATEEEKKALEGAVDTCLKYGEWQDPQKAEFLVRQGLGLAQKNGDLEGAKAKFKQAQKLDSSVDLAKLETEIKPLVAEHWIATGKTQVREGKVPEAMTLFDKAQKLEPTLKIDASDWHQLCLGGVYLRPSDVFLACDKAVELASNNKDKARHQSSRGLAKALTGDKQGAIVDFQAYINDSKTDKADKTDTADYQKWIESIEKGDISTANEILQKLKSQ
jgi:WD40 repeat protein